MRDDAAACTATANNSDDGTVCGTNRYCFTGVCADGRRSSRSAGDNQTGLVDQALSIAVQLKLVDGQNNPVSGVTLKVNVSPGASAVIAATNASGVATMTIRLGRQPKDYRTWSRRPWRTR